MFKVSEKHKHIIALLWGCARNEAAEQAGRDEDGHLRPTVPSLAHRSALDGQSTCEPESARDFWHVRNEKGNSWRDLLKNSVVSGVFCRIDVAEARARAWLRRTTDPTLDEPEDDLDKIKHIFGCGLYDEEGNPWAASFASKAARALHQRKATSGQHGLLNPLLTGVITNQCPKFPNGYSSRAITFNQAAAAYRRGTCPPRTKFSFATRW
jgi:hypothetical protein